ncbi:MAG: SHOCT domain-containing protein [Patescibacteria group bacterium]|nr:SHOCT domain-containing protein [Patescibacteria group bacterium]
MKRFQGMVWVMMFAVAVMVAGISVQAVGEDATVVAGQSLWKELQSGKTQCANFRDEDFENLGEYFMDGMMGNAHEAMDQSVRDRAGAEGLRAMHETMGERFSGCNPDAVYEGSDGYGMMGLWGGNASNSLENVKTVKNGVGSAPWGYPVYNMMGYGYGFGHMGTSGWIVMFLFWALIIAGIVMIVRWATSVSGSNVHRKGLALEIVKERYAKGEIDRKEFEEKKKDLLA